VVWPCREKTCGCCSKESRSDGGSGGARIIIKPGQKNLQHFYYKKLQTNNKKSKEIAQFIGVYIRNSGGFT